MKMRRHSNFNAAGEHAKVVDLLCIFRRNSDLTPHGRLRLCPTNVGFQSSVLSLLEKFCRLTFVLGQFSLPGERFQIEIV